MAENEDQLPCMIDGFILVSQKISNFLSSTTAFLDQTKCQIRRIYGPESVELTAWDEKRKDLHAASFAYRFLYGLRNFSQHRSLPISSFNLAGERASKNAPMLFNTGALILRDGLLEDGYEWEKKLQKEIQKQPPEFELMPLITGYFRCIRQLCLDAVNLQNTRLAECSHYLDAVYRTFRIPVGAVPVIFVGESYSKDLPPSRLELIPADQFRYLLREYDKLLNACEVSE